MSELRNNDVPGRQVSVEGRDLLMQRIRHRRTLEEGLYERNLRRRLEPIDDCEVAEQVEPIAHTARAAQAAVQVTLRQLVRQSFIQPIEVETRFGLLIWSQDFRVQRLRQLGLMKGAQQPIHFESTVRQN